MKSRRYQNWFLYGPLLACIFVLLAPLVFHLWFAPTRPLTYTAPQGEEAIQLVRLPEHRVFRPHDPFDARSYSAGIDRYVSHLQSREALEPYRIDANHIDLAAFWERSTPPGQQREYHAIWNPKEAVLMLQGDPMVLQEVRSRRDLGPFHALREGHIGQHVSLYRYHYAPHESMPTSPHSQRLLSFSPDRVESLASFTRVSGPGDRGYRRITESTGERPKKDLVLSVSTTQDRSADRYLVMVSVNASILPTHPSKARIAFDEKIEFREIPETYLGELKPMLVHHDTTHRDVYFALVTIEEMLTDDDIGAFIERHRSNE